MRQNWFMGKGYKIDNNILYILYTMGCLIRLYANQVLYRDLLNYLTWHPADTLRNNDVVFTPKRGYFDMITSKWRRFDVITTLLLRHVFGSNGGNPTTCKNFTRVYTLKNYCCGKQRMGNRTNHTVMRMHLKVVFNLVFKLEVLWSSL